MPLFQYAGFELISISGCPNIGVHRRKTVFLLAGLALALRLRKSHLTKADPAGQ